MLFSCLQIVFISYHISMLILKFVILSFQQIILIKLSLELPLDIITLYLQSLNLLHINVPFFMSYSILLLKVFIFALLGHDIRFSLLLQLYIIPLQYF